MAVNAGDTWFSFSRSRLMWDRHCRQISAGVEMPDLLKQLLLEKHLIGMAG